MPDAARPLVRRVRTEEGPRLRAIRLEALADPAADAAFSETRATAKARGASFWVDRAAQAATSDTAAQFVAEVSDRFVGTVSVLRPVAGQPDYLGRPNPADQAQLVAVFICADHRGHGVLGDLFGAAEAWAAGLGTRVMTLTVNVRNMRAQQAYRKLGYAPTGRTSDGPTGLELEFARSIDQHRV